MQWGLERLDDNRPSNGLKYKLGDFSLFLHKLEDLGLGERYALIGGLATSAWKKKYLTGPEIESKDLDMRASEEVAEIMQQALRKAFRRQHFKDTGITMRQFKFPEDNGRELIIDLLERVGGIDRPEDKRPQGIIERIPYVDGDGRDISVMDPLSIFMAKFNILKEYSKKRQEGTAGLFTRNDEEHMEVLAEVIPLYLADATKAYQNGQMHRNPAVVAKRFSREVFIHQDLLPVKCGKAQAAARRCIEQLDASDVSMSF